MDFSEVFFYLGPKTSCISELYNSCSVRKYFLSFQIYYLIIALDIHLCCIWKQAILVRLTLMRAKEK